MRISQVRCNELVGAAAARAGRFQVSGFAGSGYSMLTDLHGTRVFLGKDVAGWTSEALFLMRQRLSPLQVVLVTRWGVPDAYDTVGQLPFGHGLLIERKEPPTSYHD